MVEVVIWDSGNDNCWACTPNGASTPLSAGHPAWVPGRPLSKRDCNCQRRLGWFLWSYAPAFPSQGFYIKRGCGEDVFAIRPTVTRDDLRFEVLEMRVRWEGEKPIVTLKEERCLSAQFGEKTSYFHSENGSPPQKLLHKDMARWLEALVPPAVLDIYIPLAGDIKANFGDVRIITQVDFLAKFPFLRSLEAPTNEDFRFALKLICTNRLPDGAADLLGVRRDAEHLWGFLGLTEEQYRVLEQEIARTGGGSVTRISFVFLYLIKTKNPAIQQNYPTLYRLLKDTSSPWKLPFLAHKAGVSMPEFFDYLERKKKSLGPEYGKYLNRLHSRLEEDPNSLLAEFSIQEALP